MHFRAFAAAAALALAPSLAAAQPALRTLPVGSPELHTEHLAARADSFALMAVLGGGAAMAGTLTLDTRLVTWEGRAALVRVERTRDPRGGSADVDSFVVERASLAPRLLRSATPDGSLTLRVDGRRVWGDEVDGPRRQAVARTLEEPAFYANSMDLLLGALPLADGYQALLPVFDLEAAPVERAAVRVAGAEQVRTLDGGACDAWRVEVRRGGDDAVYWIDTLTLTLVRWDSGDGRMRVLRRTGCAPEAGGRAARR